MIELNKYDYLLITPNHKNKVKQIKLEN
jgi:flavoprotein